MSLLALCVSGRTAASVTISVPIDTAKPIASSFSCAVSDDVQLLAVMVCASAPPRNVATASQSRSPDCILGSESGERAGCSVGS